MPYYENVSRWIKEVPRHLKTQERCEEALWVESHSLAFVPNHCKAEGLCIKAVRRDPYALNCMPDNLKMQKICNKAIPERFKTQKMCNETVEVDPWQLYDVRDYLKTQEMCDDMVQRDSYSLQFVSDWFVTQEQLETWHDDNDYCTDDELIKWYKRYEKRKAQKAKIKEELMPIAWHPSRVMDWCMPEDEKRCQK